MAPMTDALPDPLVPAAAYDEAYYLQACMGYEEWNADPGAPILGTYIYALRRGGLRAGEVLVDIGTGRGELLALAVQSGAARAIGLEYSEAAVALAHRTLDAQGVSAEVLLADARAVPLPDAVADLVTLLDVVEHLAPAELDRSLAEAQRILRPGGRLLIHTMPNRTIYEMTYRAQRLLRPSRRRRWPVDPRKQVERDMHVNEQTVTSLRRALRRAGFAQVQVNLGDWMYTDFVPDERARRTYHRLAARPLTARLGRGDLWGRAVVPS